MKVVGRGGRDLHEHWAGDARAYLGVTIPHFPNLYVLYGPNTNIVVNGSIIYFSECEVTYVVACLREMIERGLRALDCKSAVHDAYNERIDEANANRAWGAASVNTWYKNEHGRVSQNWPSTLLEYWGADPRRRSRRLRADLSGSSRALVECLFICIIRETAN